MVFVYAEHNHMGYHSYRLPLWWSRWEMVLTWTIVVTVKMERDGQISDLTIPKFISGPDLSPELLDHMYPNAHSTWISHKHLKLSRSKQKTQTHTHKKNWQTLIYLQEEKQPFSLSVFFVSSETNSCWSCLLLVTANYTA